MMNQIKKILEDAMNFYGDMYLKDLNRTKNILKLR